MNQNQPSQAQILRQIYDDGSNPLNQSDVVSTVAIRLFLKDNPDCEPIFTVDPIKELEINSLQISREIKRALKNDSEFFKNNPLVKEYIDLQITNLEDTCM